jgi:hypothetical protein
MVSKVRASRSAIVPGPAEAAAALGLVHELAALGSHVCEKLRNACD